MSFQFTALQVLTSDIGLVSIILSLAMKSKDVTGSVSTESELFLLYIQVSFSLDFQGTLFKRRLFVQIKLDLPNGTPGGMQLNTPTRQTLYNSY